MNGFAVPSTWAPQAMAAAVQKAMEKPPVDQCEQHPGIRWIGGHKPCWLCDPEWWAANPPAPMNNGGAPQSEDAADVETIVREWQSVIFPTL